MKLNPFVKAGLGLSFALLWSCPTLAALTADKNFGLEVKITGQSEDDRDLGTARGGDVNGIGLDLRPWLYGERGHWSAYAMGQAVAASDIIETDTLQQASADASQPTDNGDRRSKKTTWPCASSGSATAVSRPTPASSSSSAANACATMTASGATPTSKR